MSLRERLRSVAAAVATAALALAVAPAVAMAAPQAQGGNSLTVNGVKAGDTVTIYQIVETTVDDTNNEASNDFVVDFDVDFDKDWTGATSSLPDQPGYPVEATEAMANTIATYVNEYAIDWTEGTPGDPEVGATKYTSSNVQSNSVKFENIEAGQYLVVVTNANDATRVFQNTIVSVLQTLEDGTLKPAEATVNVKYTSLVDPDDPTSSVVKKQVKKEGAADSTYADTLDTADKNDTVTFQITTVIPRYTANYGTRGYALSDDMPDGLVRSSDGFVVKAGEATLTSEQYILAPGQDADDFTLTLTEDTLKNFGGQTLTVTYNATFNGEDLPTYDAAEINTATVTFKTDSINDNVKSDTDSAYVVVYGLTFNKVNDEGTMLDGAEFEIKDGNNVVATATSENGVVTVNGALAADVTYTLHEKKAPTGYMCVDDATFTITSDIQTDVDGVTTSGTLVELKNASYTAGGQLNEQGALVDPDSNIFAVLPETGGTGTVALTVVGVGLMAGAAYLVVRSRKEN